MKSLLHDFFLNYKKYNVSITKEAIVIVFPGNIKRSFMNWLDCELSLKREFPKLYQEYLSFQFACL